MMRPTMCTVLSAMVLQVACASDAPPAAPPADVAAPTSSVRRTIAPTVLPRDRPYAYGVRVGDLVFLSGQLGRHPTTGALPEGIAAQTQQAMDNIGTILAAEGLDHRHLVKCHVYLASMDDYAAMNKVYGGVFTDRVPARTTVEAAAVPGGAAVEIGCIAYADLSGISVVRPPDGALPAPLGPYSAAVRAGDTVFLSGMGGQHPADRRVDDPVPAQVTQTLANIGTTLAAAGLGFEHVIAATSYITTPDEMAGVDAAFAAPFAAAPPPAGSLVFLPRLPGPIKAELTLVASTSPSRLAFVPARTAPAAGPSLDLQWRAVLTHLREDLEARGADWADVAHVQVYLADLADMPAMDAAYRETFAQDPPARTTIQARLAGEARVQVSLIAARTGQDAPVR